MVELLFGCYVLACFMVDGVCLFLCLIVLSASFAVLLLIWCWLDITSLVVGLFLLLCVGSVC